MSSYHAGNSHDPKTDRTSLMILVGVAALIVVGGFFAFTSSEPASLPPVKLHSIDGCDLYRAKDRGNRVYFARCGNGKASTTHDGRHVITGSK